MSGLNVQLLGGFRLLHDGELVTTVNTPRLQSLLAYILVYHDTLQPRRQVAFNLWPDSSESQAMRNLRKQLHHLRQALPEADRFLYIDPQNLGWRAGAHLQLDIANFSHTLQKVEQATRADSQQDVRRTLERAVDCYKGDLLPSCYDEWIEPERERLRSQYTQILEQLVQLAEVQRDHAAALRYGQRLLRHDPLRENTYRRLMLIHHRDGDQASAVQVYQTCAETLKQHLDVEPSPETHRVYEQILHGEAASSQYRALPLLPAALIGRKKEMAEIGARLQCSDCRLLTLVGPAGIGKTRLALEAAREYGDEFFHGVSWISLAHVAAPEQLVTTIAEALHFYFTGTDTPETQLLHYLQRKKLLLVLDNFEHLLRRPSQQRVRGAIRAQTALERYASTDCTDLLTTILETAPGVKFLVTSRQRLNLQWEWLYDVHELPVPDREEHEPLRFASAKLFVQVARQVEPHFYSVEEADSVARICRLVGGMPLAIKLAAALIRDYSCSEVASLLEQSTKILATSLRDVPARHRSLYAAFEHSWELLSSQEQQAFSSLAVFQGPFDAEAADVIAGTSAPLLTTLIDKSLLQTNVNGEYELHPLLHQFASDKLAKHPREQNDCRKHHAQYYAAFVQYQAGRLETAEQPQALDAIASVMENVQAAWDYAVDRRGVAAILQLMGGLYTFFKMRGRFKQGERLFASAAHVLEGVPAHYNCKQDYHLLHHRLRARRAALLYQQGRYNQAEPLLLSSLTAFKQADCRSEVAFCLHNLGRLAYRQGRYAETRKWLHEGLVLSRSIGDPRRTASALTTLGDVARQVGKYGEAHQVLQESLALHRQMDDRWGLANSLNNLGIVTGAVGNYEESRRLLEESLTIRRQMDDRWGVAKVLNNLGLVARLQNQHTEAKEHFEESLAIRRQIGNRFGISIALNNLGLVALDLGDDTKAEAYFEESFSMRRQDGDRWGMATSLNYLGQAAIARKEWDEARSCFLKALSLVREVGAMPDILDVLVGLAEVLVHAGSRQEAQEILTAVYHHPAAEGETKDRSQRLLTDLAAPDEVDDLGRNGNHTSPTVEEMTDSILSASRPGT